MRVRGHDDTTHFPLILKSMAFLMMDQPEETEDSVGVMLARCWKRRGEVCIRKLREGSPPPSAFKVACRDLRSQFICMTDQAGGGRKPMTINFVNNLTRGYIFYFLSSSIKLY